MFSNEEPFYPKSILQSFALNNSKALELLDEVLQLNETNLSDRYDRVACSHFVEYISPTIADSKFSVVIGALFPDEKLAEFQGLYKGTFNTGWIDR